MMCQLWCCGVIVRGIPLVWGVLVVSWIGVLKVVDGFLYISWHADVHYAYFVVPVQCDTTVETPGPILCDLIFLLECMYEVQCVFSILFYN